VPGSKHLGDAVSLGDVGFVEIGPAYFAVLIARERYRSRFRCPNFDTGLSAGAAVGASFGPLSQQSGLRPCIFPGFTDRRQFEPLG
jgi:ABC-type branched-subunit amino acid transport system permease subunit